MSSAVKPSPLTAAQVEESRRLHGSNQLTQRKKRGFFRQFLSNFGDPIIKILLVALAVNVIFLFHHFDWYESAGIAIAIFLATFVSTLSEHGSEAAFAKLQEEAASISCRVKRDGRVVSCPFADVVVGDLVLLQAGERVPADGLLIEGSLRVDQSALNGESKEAKKTAALGDLSPTDDFLSPSHLFRGSVVCEGEGVLWVRQVGDQTFYGHLAREIQEGTRESPLKVRLAGLARTISRMGYVAAILVALADLAHALFIDYGFNWTVIAQQFSEPSVVFGHVLHALTLAITVVVVAVPEGLPMMITVVLSRNMRRMLKDHVLVRKPVGIETSGSLNLLFTDKTGTITKGQPEVARFVDGEGTLYKRRVDLVKQCPALWEQVARCCRYNNESVVSGRKALGGNATDRTLLEYILPLPKGAPEHTDCHVPFDSARKFSSIRVGGKTTFLKGAPEKLLPACTRYIDASGAIKPLTRRFPLEQRLRELTEHAMRVLLLCASERPVTASSPFSDLLFLGLVGIRDDVRPEAAAAIQQVQGAGVQVVMITGDNRETAAAIAREVGLLSPADDGAILTSGELNALTDEQVVERLPRLRVVARALPTDKSRLVRLAQQAGLVTGMTGDGINDAPALKKADVGFAMGSGTEVAKEAGDIVILDNNFASIARAILYGRTIFKSIRKFIIFQLTMNLCAVGVSIIGPFIGIDTPVTVIQMLWINIIMDTLAGLAFAGEPPLQEYMEEPPKKRDEPVLNRYMLNQILFTGSYTVLLCVLFLKLPFFESLFRSGADYIYLMTAFFALFIFTGVFNCFNARTPRLNLLSHLRGNRTFVVILALVAAVQILLIYYGGSLFRTAGLTFPELVRVLLIAFTVVPVDIGRKLILRLGHHKGTI